MVDDGDVRRILDMLPAHSFVKNYVLWAETQTASPLLWHLGMAIYLVGLTSPASHIAQGFLAPTFTNSWMLIVGESGGQKTLAVELARRMLVDADAARLIAPDPTSEEALLKYLEVQPTQGYFYPEGQTFLANTTGATNYRTKLRGAFMEWFDGIDKARVDSKGNEYPVRNPRLSMVVACTPRHLEDFTTLLDWEGGFVGRFAILAGVGTRTMTRRAHLPEMYAWLKTWLAMSKGMGASTDGGWLTPGAQAQWDAWVTDLRARAPALSLRVAPLLRRADLIAAKVATILARDVYAMQGQPWMIDEAVLTPAIAFAELHIRCTVAVSANIAASDEQREMLATLNATGDDWTARGAISRRAEITVPRVKRYLETLKEQGRVELAQQADTEYARKVVNGTARPWIENYVPPSGDPPPMPGGNGGGGAG